MKTFELTGRALDWAVAKAERMSWWVSANAKWDNNDGYTELILDSDGVLKRFMFDGSRSRAGHWESYYEYKPSTDWSQGGPIIEREKIAVDVRLAEWIATNDSWDHYFSGPTPLVAAMRAFVTGKLGDEVEVPKELL